MSRFQAFITILFFALLSPAVAQTYRVERFQDGRPLRQGKFLISAGWSFLGMGYSVNPLGVAQNPPTEPIPEDPSSGVAGISGSFGVAPFMDIGLEIGGGFGGPSFAGWLKSSLLPYSSPFQVALHTTFGNSWAELRVPVDDPVRTSRLIRSSLFVSNFSVPISYDLDSSWTLMVSPHLAFAGYRAGVGFDSIAPNGLNVSTLAETQASGWFYGFSIGAKVVRPSPEWWQYLLPVPFWASGSMMLSFMWNQGTLRSVSLGYQHLFPSFGTLLTTVTQDEMDNIEHERRQKDSLVALQKQQLELERSRTGRALSAEILTIKGVYENGKEELNPTLNIEETSVRESRPLLASVYFEHNSFVIPTRYKRLRSADRMSFSIENVAHLRLVEVYRNILNIVGKRMNDKPEARLVLTGFTSGIGEEANNRALAERRATAILDYLADVWKISTSRITITLGEAQTFGRNTDTASFRRVDLRSDDADILGNIDLAQTQRTITPTIIDFGLDIASGIGVKQWTMELSQVEGNEVRTLKMDNGTRSNTAQYRWNITENPSSVPSSAENIVARLEVTDITNRTAESSLALIPVQYMSLAAKRSKGKPDERIDVQYRWLFGQDAERGIESNQLPVLPSVPSDNAKFVIITPATATNAQIQALNDALKEQFKEQSLRTASVRNAPQQKNIITTPEERIYGNLYKFEYYVPFAVK
ncbi:MAG: OmpA family protein [Candidatus Kapabacteria bacterium]|jgi:hypothetical protein|nr:OmpA family protein [Candidatus Kapabacteria bacterium]